MKFAACEFVVAPWMAVKFAAIGNFFLTQVVCFACGDCLPSHWRQMLHFAFTPLSQYSYYEFNAHMPCSCINYSAQRQQPSLLADELFFALRHCLSPILLLGHQKLCQLSMMTCLVIDAWKIGIIHVEFAQKQLEDRAPIPQCHKR